jgi:quercetin dioxygenase-like cupin family protein
MPAHPHIRSAADVPPLNVVGEQIRVLTDGAQTGSFEVFLQDGEPGIGPPPHFHAWDEAYYIISGELDVQIGAEQRTMKAGELAFIPAGTVHCYRNRSRARFISMTSKEGASRFFAAMDREVGLPLDLGKAVEVAGRNGVFVPPPPPPAPPAGG